MDEAHTPDQKIFQKIHNLQREVLQSDPDADEHCVPPEFFLPRKKLWRNPFFCESHGSFFHWWTARQSPTGSFPDASCESRQSLPHLTDLPLSQNEN